MFKNGIFVRNGKVVIKEVPQVCGGANHIFSHGQHNPCDCGVHKNFFIAEADISQEPVARKGHLALIKGGK